MTSGISLTLVFNVANKGDSLKLALSWKLYDRLGYGQYIDTAFCRAGQLAMLVVECPDLNLVSDNLPPCLQVYFYHGVGWKEAIEQSMPDGNTRRTRLIRNALVSHGFLID